MGEFKPQYAIVTASDSGIGKATAVALAEQGMDVGITWHTDSDGAEATAEEVRSHGRKAVVAHLDTTEPPAAAWWSTTWPRSWAGWTSS